jgi:hypothetical protein
LRCSISGSFGNLEIPLLFVLLYLFLDARSGRSDEWSVLDSTRLVRGLARMTSTDGEFGWGGTSVKR